VNGVYELKGHKDDGSPYYTHQLYPDTPIYLQKGKCKRYKDFHGRAGISGSFPDIWFVGDKLTKPVEHHSDKCDAYAMTNVTDDAPPTGHRDWAVWCADLWVEQNLYLYPRCPDSVTINGTDFAMMEKQPGQDEDHEVYQNDAGTFLYYWAPTASWIVGSDYKKAEGKSSDATSSTCPDFATWSGQPLVHEEKAKPTPAPTTPAPTTEMEKCDMYDKRTQCMGLSQNTAATDWHACQQACCDDHMCKEWQFQEPDGCWMGVSTECDGAQWPYGAKKRATAPPTPLPPGNSAEARITHFANCKKNGMNGVIGQDTDISCGGLHYSDCGKNSRCLHGKCHCFPGSCAVALSNGDFECVSEGDCPRFTGGTCRVSACEERRHAECHTEKDVHRYSCVCRQDQCAENGRCIELMSLDGWDAGLDDDDEEDEEDDDDFMLAASLGNGTVPLDLLGYSNPRTAEEASMLWAFPAALAFAAVAAFMVVKELRRPSAAPHPATESLLSQA